MANTVVISRANLVYGICLPLAVLLGYLLASPFESGSVVVVVLVLSMLSIPVLLRWHHALLIFSCNAAIFPLLPGHPTLWMVAALISFFFLVLDRSLGRDVRFFRVPSVAFSLIFIVIVVMVTARLVGGFGFGSLGAKTEGARRYLVIDLAAILYFALATVQIKRKYATLAVGAFFLSTLTGLIAYAAAAGGKPFYFLAELFPVANVINELNPYDSGEGLVRLGELSNITTGFFCFVLAYYGAQGILDLRKPWRLGLILLAVVANLYSGFRSSIILFIIVFFILFYLEGLFRTRYLPAMLLTFALTFAIALPFVEKFPLVVQRAISFLPVTVDPRVRDSAEGSTDWRLEMWKEVLPTVPQYLFKGKGYAMNPEDVYLIQQAQLRGYARDYDVAMLAGDYHSGPLSVIIPFGIFGAIGFLWFLGASLRVLWLNSTYGEPSLKHYNRFLLAYFIGRIVLFFMIFGSFHADMVVFTSVIGLSVSLNGGVAKPLQPSIQREPELEMA